MSEIEEIDYAELNRYLALIRSCIELHYAEVKLYNTDEYTRYHVQDKEDDILVTIYKQPERILLNVNGKEMSKSLTIFDYDLYVSYLILLSVKGYIDQDELITDAKEKVMQ